ncbi:hypothetical protein GCM10007981_11240 [Thermocladium modestius]|uniref:Uncharacterized protein n=1 Tax=Thermocladium modestius TaxID=62609 RepID=A0A830GVI6_9CREN|nr:hypothetical protein [Thermocladium modestius]GGP20980.1 hypothetical protein GCM10007981_11240 [Thermocladium modestius]
MLLVMGRTAGLSSKALEGRYKTPDDIRDIHLVSKPRLGDKLMDFAVTDDPDGLTLISFDIPGGGARIYSKIKETAAWLLSPRMDNSTYLAPSHEAKQMLLSKIPTKANAVEYQVEPMNRQYVEAALGETFIELTKYARKRLMGLINSRGQATSISVEALSTWTNAAKTASREWRRRGFNVDNADRLIKLVEDMVEFKEERRGRAW